MKTCLKVPFLAITTVIVGYIPLMILSPQLYSRSSVTHPLTIKPLLSRRLYNSMDKITRNDHLDMNEVEKELSIRNYVPNKVIKSIDEKIRLTVSPLLVANGGEVTVQWNNLHHHTCNSWIGLYCPARSSHFNTIDFWWIKDLVDNTQTYISVRFTLYNVRTDCQFRYFVNDTATKLVAVSSKIHFIDAQNSHLHVHLALTNKHNEMRVQWTTGKECVPTVHYGRLPDNLNLKATGISRTYAASDMCGPPANMSAYFINPGYLHDVLLTDLTPNTQYYYQVSGTGISSETMTFRTSPYPGSNLPLTFDIYGDMDITKYSEQTAARVLTDIERGASFILHIGDLSYATGIAYRWDEWMTLIEPLSSRVPYMVSVGNHEQCSTGDNKNNPSGNSFHPTWGNYRHDSGGECGMPTSKRFHMPDNGNGVWWYSFKYGLTHIIQLSTEHSLSPGSDQYIWLERALESVDRETTPWLIVTGHRPLYNSVGHQDDFNVSLYLRRDIDDLLHTHGVDLFVAGHYHSYERTCQVYKGKCTPDGVLHVTVGCAGMYLEPAPLLGFDWSKHYEASYGYGRVTIISKNELLWEFVRVEDGFVSDHFRLHKLNYL
ncbi:uncharacterized protein LOC135339098 [Halichondria panicea]|uniref:uncharacterized protein LOC135339098 n=1 Tax=Halichondria panicea TaxID=6063 RepID=UPI00312B8047